MSALEEYNEYVLHGDADNTYTIFDVLRRADAMRDELLARAVTAEDSLSDLCDEALQARRLERISNGDCPCCWADDESGHTPECELGQAEAALAAIVEVLDKLESRYLGDPAGEQDLVERQDPVQRLITFGLAYRYLVHCESCGKTVPAAEAEGWGYTSDGVDLCPPCWAAFIAEAKEEKS